MAGRLVGSAIDRQKSATVSCSSSDRSIRGLRVLRGARTHELGKLDDIGFLTDDVVTEEEAGSSAAELLRGMTVDSLRDAIGSN